MNIIHVSAVSLIDPDGRVLLAQRPAGKAMAGMWEFPGGKIEAGETPEAALIRELHEELGIDVSESCLAPLSFVSHSYREMPPAPDTGADTCPQATHFTPASALGIKEPFHLVMFLFACRKWHGNPAPREHTALRWVRPAEMRGLPLPPADLPFIPILQELL